MENERIITIKTNIIMTETVIMKLVEVVEILNEVMEVLGNQEQVGSRPQTITNEDVVPEVLRTPDAEALHAKLLTAGILDANWQPIALSYAEKGTLVEYVARILDIRNQWKFFSDLWQINGETLRTSRIRGLNQDKTWQFRKTLEGL